MKRSYLLLFLFSLLVSLPGLANLPPIDRDEPRYLQATKQMAETGDYVDIRFQEETRYKKPIGIYWLQSAAVLVSAQGAEAPIWVYRLVSALGIALAVVGVAWGGQALFNRDAGIVAGLVLAAIVSTSFEGRNAKTDAALLACIVFAQVALAQIYVAARAGRESSLSLPWIFWVAQGLGILIKGPIAPLVSALTIVALGGFDRDVRWLARLKPIRGLLLTILIVAPWLIAISVKSGAAFWVESVGKDMLGKVGGVQESHGGPPGYYLVTNALFVWPFVLVAVAAALKALPLLRQDARLRFLFAWWIPFWLVLELVPTKLPNYVLPTHAALALLIGWLSTLALSEASQPLSGWKLWAWRGTALGTAVVTLGLTIGVVVAPLYFAGGFSIWSLPAALCVLGAGLVAASPSFRVTIGSAAGAAVLAAAAYGLIYGVIAPKLDSLWLSRRINTDFQTAKPCADSMLSSSAFHEPSLVFLTGTKTKLTDLAGVVESLRNDPACALGLVSIEQAAQLEEQTEALGLRVQNLAVQSGINYSTGRRMTLLLYKVSQ